MLLSMEDSSGFALRLTKLRKTGACSADELH